MGNPLPPPSARYSPLPLSPDIRKSNSESDDDQPWESSRTKQSLESQRKDKELFLKLLGDEEDSSTVSQQPDNCIEASATNFSNISLSSTPSKSPESKQTSESDLCKPPLSEMGNNSMTLPSHDTKHNPTSPQQKSTLDFNAISPTQFSPVSPQTLLNRGLKSPPSASV